MGLGRTPARGPCVSSGGTSTNNNLSLEKRAALSTPLHYTLLPHHIPPRPHTALSENNVGRDWEGGKEGELEPRRLRRSRLQEDTKVYDEFGALPSLSSSATKSSFHLKCPVFGPEGWNGKPGARPTGCVYSHPGVLPLCSLIALVSRPPYVTGLESSASVWPTLGPKFVEW